MGTAYESAQKVWDVENEKSNTDKDSEIASESADQFLARLQKAIKTVWGDKDVRASLSDVSTSTSTFGKQAGRASLTHSLNGIHIDHSYTDHSPVPCGCTLTHSHSYTHTHTLTLIHSYSNSHIHSYRFLC